MERAHINIQLFVNESFVERVASHRLVSIIPHVNESFVELFASHSYRLVSILFNMNNMAYIVL